MCGIDLAVSLSRPGVLHGGNFDGFPTGSSVEASLSGAAALEQSIRSLLREPRRIATIARRGQAFTRGRYAPERQIAPRWALLSALMAELALPARSTRAA